MDASMDGYTRDPGRLERVPQVLQLSAAWLLTDYGLRLVRSLGDYRALNLICYRGNKLLDFSKEKCFSDIQDLMQHFYFKKKVRFNSNQLLLLKSFSNKPGEKSND